MIPERLTRDEARAKLSESMLLVTGDFDSRPALRARIATLEGALRELQETAMQHPVDGYVVEACTKALSTDPSPLVEAIGVMMRCYGNFVVNGWKGTQDIADINRAMTTLRAAGFGEQETTSPNKKG